MFNFLASSLLVYLLVNHMKVPGSMAVESAPSRRRPTPARMHEFLAWFGIEWSPSPLNTSVFLARWRRWRVYLLLWHTRAGYELRATGSSPGAAAMPASTRAARCWWRWRCRARWPAWWA